MPKAPIKWTYGGRPLNPREIKAEILESYEEVGDKAVEELTKEVESLVNRLKKRSKETNPFSKANSFADSEVEVYEKEPGVWRIRVTGLVFNWLDQGRKSFRAKNKPFLVFPMYTGTLTKRGTNSSVLNASGIRYYENTFVRKKRVKAIRKRGFLEDIVKKRRKNLNYLRSGRTYKTGKGYKWRFDPRETYVTIVKGGE